MKCLAIGVLCAFSIALSMANTMPTDTIKTKQLKEVKVEARNQQLGAEVSIYIPTSKQKNASQTGTDLLNRMAIPQLRVSSTDEVTTLAGKSVDIFIDFIPASANDLKGMRMQDVKKVEYYDFPTDPRFQGKPHVVNFVMHKYEYGGYVKAYGWEQTGSSGQISLYSKLQYKRMTFDVAAGAFYVSQRHNGSDTYETFRLPQADGSVSVFERNSLRDNGALRRQSYWPTFKALYSSPKITLQNIIGASFDNTPANDQSGHIVYSPEIAPRTDFSNHTEERVKSFSYSGYWNFILNDKNTITFYPRYAYSHTNTNTLYAEKNVGKYYNAAKDDSHQFRGNLTYTHSFGKWGNLKAMLQALITTNKTSYFGTSNTSDNAHSYRVGPCVNYSISIGEIYAMAGFGFEWDRQEYLDYKENNSVPWIDFSLQYAPSNRHSVRMDFHHSKWAPSSSFRSLAVIQSNPLMSYTGNPNIVSYGSYDAGVNYSFIPNNNFSFSAYASMWIVDNRYVYDYEPTPTGILRTIKQPGGGYSQWSYGIYGALRLFDNNLYLTANVFARTVHNGEPYNLNKTNVAYTLSANYYLGNWSLSAVFRSPSGWPDGCMVGTWMKMKSYYDIQVGWYNASWNIRLQLANFGRWNWQSSASEMHSRYYDRTENIYSLNYHATANLSVTYTFGYGKKIKQGNEAYQQSGVNSGILK